MKPNLCRLRFHKWVCLACVVGGYRYRCARCGKKRFVNWSSKP